MSPRSDYPVVDVSAHIYPETDFPPGFGFASNPIFGDATDVPEDDLRNVIGTLQRGPDHLLEMMEDGGIDRAVVSMPYWMGHDDSEKVAQANDNLIDIVHDHDVFYGFAALPVAAGGTTAAEEFERSLDNGFHGGAVETKSGGIEVNDEELEPVLEVADERGAPLLVHPKIDESLHPEALDDRYSHNAIFGREVALATSICKVIHDGVLDEHRNLNLIYHHLGGNICGMMGRVYLRIDKQRWPGLDHLKPFDEFKQQMEERIYLDTCGFFAYPSPVQAAIEQMPSSQLLLGSDYPAEPRNGEEYGKLATVVREHASQTDAEKILGGNVLDLLVNTD